ncbi:hypothetical protein RvY_18687 [Ramazzottius varieornatus]|uniref:Uncharacterized protein n=1 Tax=Ramazzottius varieornatus TaxID=947166 RepID=A0A1D1W6P8_RAMVA|nr:hypothetical protein RvY_18687 [Ramazzottius varieornatus]
MTIRTCASAKAQVGCTTVPANENEATTNCKCVSDRCNSQDEAPEKPFVKIPSSTTSYPCVACVPDADKDVIDGARGGGDDLTVPNGTQYQCMTNDPQGCLDVYTTSTATGTLFPSLWDA